MGEYIKNRMTYFLCSTSWKFCKNIAKRTHLGGVFEKQLSNVLSPHRLHVYAKFGVIALMICENVVWTSQTGGRADITKSIYLVALIKNIYTLECRTCWITNSLSQMKYYFNKWQFYDFKKLLQIINAIIRNISQTTWAS